MNKVHKGISDESHPPEKLKLLYKDYIRKKKNKKEKMTSKTINSRNYKDSLYICRNRNKQKGT